MILETFKYQCRTFVEWFLSISIQFSSFCTAHYHKIHICLRGLYKYTQFLLTFKEEDFSSDICHGIKASLTALLKRGVRTGTEKS